jgi:hypothetical protein
MPRIAFTIFALALLLQAVAHAADPVPPKEMWPAKGDHAAILRLLQDTSAAGIDRKLGPGYDFYHRQAVSEKFPEIYLAPSKQENGGRRYQLGGPWSKSVAGDFSSTEGQVLYAPDAGGFPIDRVMILEWSNGVFSERPEEPWHGGFRPDPAAAKWKQAAADGNIGMPIAMARGMGGWSNCGIAVFSSGLVATAGTVTARGTDPTFQFPPNKFPTAISVTNKNEFALITVVDTETKKGQVAVLALSSNGTETHFVHEWKENNPGLPNVAVFTGMKLLGYIDLPGIDFPTGICAVGNKLGGRLNGRDGNAGLLREWNLAVQGDRDSFYKGGNAGFTSTAGFAVVISKYENKAAFIDLQPLFERTREMYFTSDANYRKTREQGPGPKEWPYTFEGDSHWKPPVVKVIDVVQPTAVLASMSGGEKARAFIASLDGKLGVYSIGGLATDAPASPHDIIRLGDVKIGRNTTCLNYQKYSTDTFLAVSRGDREISWIKYNDKGAQVVRTLRDSRLIDPVYCEVADTHGIETSLLTVADFKGRKILNYRFSQLVFATQGGAKFGMGPEGKDEFECGGIMEFPGSPFCVTASNVN